ncbi:MAG: hypothetical protein RLZZ319_266 [Actinomycetota bacterium]
MTIEAASPRDLEIMHIQLGRPMRDVVGVAARCVCGAPTVVATKPRLADGQPFPTFYYLTHPAAASALSTLEANGFMVTEQEKLAKDDGFAAAYVAAHTAYIHDRDEHGHVAEIDGISAGGMPTRVKCLHALAAHSLAVGPGINLVGDEALAACGWSPTRCVCAPETR